MCSMMVIYAVLLPGNFPLSQIYALLSVKFSGLKTCECKKADKYQAWLIYWKKMPPTGIVKRKITRETLDVRSAKRKPREEREHVPMVFPDFIKIVIERINGLRKNLNKLPADLCNIIAHYHYKKSSCRS